ncbi:EAL domain-containing protein [Oceanicoccus sagamiensis]|uniref:GGDEF-domain containing protein n=1 Tax=Oceanicoccus sagamiensis TaxID=716816 RepID=A0A1X9NFL0_9GAMM|nr:EAL domain-containing protein [Oceanicoccus sagamiensis]ARN74665.1 hypothetical protein BST96_11350 [Oceanicoccus sagamiensis]
MRIKVYLAILVFCCLLSGYALDQVLSLQFRQLQWLDHKLHENRLLAKDLERIKGNAAQYLVSTDLIMGSGSSYLAHGAIKIGNYLIEDLRRVRNEYGESLPIEKIVASVNHIVEINKLVDAAQFDSESLEAVVESSWLVIYDDHAYKLSKHIAYLSSLVDKRLVAKTGRRDSAERSLMWVSWFSRLVFLLIVIILWFWANKKICKPLYFLQKSSSEAVSGGEFTITKDAPKEILHLSNDFKKLTETLFHQADHDPLTGLNNRRSFERHMANMNPIEDGMNYICFIDLDYFKTINDSCGHDVGDEILVKVARLLSHSVRSCDMVARLGGDEFVIVLNDCNLPAAKKINNKICNAIRDIRYCSAGEEYYLSASIGISASFNRGKTTTEILGTADIACNLAKESGRNAVHAFDKAHDNLSLREEKMVSIHQIDAALSNGDFVLYKQDIVSLSDTPQDSGIEILLRMKNKEGGLIGPDQFLPVADRYNKIVEIDRCVVATAFNWFDAHPSVLKDLAFVSINLSVKSLSNKRFENFVIDTVVHSHVPARKICFEITETAAIDNITRVQGFMNNVKAIGCTFALDDFGSGHSSYSYIKDLPSDALKIDGSFVVGMLQNPLDYAAVKSICEISKAANQKIVAEFVENEAIVAQLKELGVDYAQGYYFSKPEPLSSLKHKRIFNSNRLRPAVCYKPLLN